MNLLVKNLLSGDFEDLEHFEHLEDRYLHPSQVCLLTENISEQDREMGVGFYVIYLPKPVVKLSFTFDCATYRPEFVWRWIRYCVNDDLVEYFLSHISQHVIHTHLYANPHPSVVHKVVDTPFSDLSISVYANPADEVVNLWCTPEFVYDSSLCYEISSNTNEKVVELVCSLADRGEGVDWPTFGRLCSERAVQRTVKAIREGQARLSWFLDCPRICEEFDCVTMVKEMDNQGLKGLWSDDLKEFMESMDRLSDTEDPVTLLSVLGRRNDCNVLVTQW